MPIGRGGISRATLVVLACIVPFAILRLAGRAPEMLINGAVTAQIGVIAWLLTARLAMPARALAAAGATALAVAALLRSGLPASSVELGFGGLCHALAYSSLLALFAASLRPGREPMVTRFARRIRRTMPADVIRYTRHVTLAWCVLFATQLGISAILLAAAPLAIWSAFVEFWSTALVAAMFLAEFGCRLVRFRHDNRTGLVATLAGLRQVRDPP